MTPIATASTATTPDVHAAVRLTRTQRRFLRALARHSALLGCPASLREVGALIGIASTGHLLAIRNRLAEKGCVTHRPQEHRTMRLTDVGRALLAAMAAETTPDERAESEAPS